MPKYRWGHFPLVEEYLFSLLVHTLTGNGDKRSSHKIMGEPQHTDHMSLWWSYSFEITLKPRLWHLDQNTSLTEPKSCAWDSSQTRGTSRYISQGCEQWVTVQNWSPFLGKRKPPTERNSYDFQKVPDEFEWNQKLFCLVESKYFAPLVAGKEACLGCLISPTKF